MEERKLDDKDKADFYGSLQFCAGLLDYGEIVFNITVRVFTLSFSPVYRAKLQEGNQRRDTALVSVFDNILLSLDPETLSESKEEASDAWTRFFFYIQYEKAFNNLNCFSALLHLDEVTKTEMEHLLESLPSTYISQQGENSA